MKIFAFIVTYNRLSLLKKALPAIQMQTHTVDKIIVINNNSTDGTKEWLMIQNNLQIIEQENSGGAGGFHTGVKYCFENGADWIWMIDDDVFPEETCLENLLKYNYLSKCLQPTRFYSDGKIKNWNKYYSLKKNKMFHYDQVNENLKEFTFVNTACFEGMLIHRDIVEKIGFPDKRFFISGDDTIYGYLANIHTNICLVRDAKMNRAKKSTEELYSPMYLYYSYRNFHLIEEYYSNIFNKKFYPLRIRFRHILTAFYSSILITISKNYSLKNKFRLTRHIFKGIRDSNKKLIERSL